MSVSIGLFARVSITAVALLALATSAKTVYALNHEQFLPAGGCSSTECEYQGSFHCRDVGGPDCKCVNPDCISK